MPDPLTTTRLFTHPLGIVRFHAVSKGEGDYYEYGELDNPHWDLCDRWFAADIVHAFIPKRGDGRLLLQDFVKTLPTGAGLLLNPVPLSSTLTYETLVSWYVSLGFIYFDGCSTLYKLV